MNDRMTQLFRDEYCLKMCKNAEREDGLRMRSTIYKVFLVGTTWFSEDAKDGPNWENFPMGVFMTLDEAEEAYVQLEKDFGGSAYTPYLAVMPMGCFIKPLALRGNVNFEDREEGKTPNF